jgi:hypothetical protein
MNKTIKPLCANGCGNRCARAKATYCSLRCRFTHDFRIRVRLIETGRYPARPLCRWLRKYLAWKCGEKCSRCGWAERNPRTGRVPIEVEHIDGHWKNNNPENLALLCPNCHSLTPTFRGLNRGRGRAHRLGGRKNPLRGDIPKNKRTVQALAPFPLPRRLVELVEARDATLPHSDEPA